MKKVLSRNMLPFIAASILIIVGLFSILKLLSYNYPKQSAIKLTDGWDVNVNGKIYHDVRLSDLEFKNLKKGDVVSFRNKIPEDVVENQTMIFNTYLSSVSVVMDGQTLYEYSTKPSEENDIVGSGCHFVIIPSYSSGKTIQINVKAKQDNAFTNMENFIFVPAATAYCYYVDQKIFGVFISIFLLVFGIVLSFTSAFSLISDTKNIRLLYIGLFSFFMGLWSMNNIKILQIFNIDLGASTTSEYLSLFAAPIPIICLVGIIRKDDSKMMQLAIKAIASIFLLFIFITTFLHFGRIVHYSQVLTLFHMMVAITILFMLITSIKRGKKKSVSETTMSLGFFILFLSFAADMVRFNVQKYIMPNNEHLYESFIPLGTLIFIILLLYSYISSTLDMLHAKAEQAILSHMAYFDGLCDIYNRAKCDVDFTELNQSSEDYALINIDLNGLKAINDHLGHEYGDKLLRTYAQILKEAFSLTGSYYRMGGDEFLVIVHEKNFDAIPDCIEHMKVLEATKSKELNFCIESSYGIAYRSEVPEGTTAKVYSLADQKMYQMKQASKKTRRD